MSVSYLELLTELDLAEEDPGVIVPPVPMELEVAHALQDSLEFLIAD